MEKNTTEISNNKQSESKLTVDEQEEIVHLNASYQEVLLELGQLYLRKLQVDEETKAINTQEKEHRHEYTEIQKKENDFVSRLTRKYGEGRLDAPRGIYIKS